MILVLIINAVEFLLFLSTGLCPLPYDLLSMFNKHDACMIKCEILVHLIQHKTYNNARLIFSVFNATFSNIMATSFSGGRS